MGAVRGVAGRIILVVGLKPHVVTDGVDAQSGMGSHARACPGTGTAACCSPSCCRGVRGASTEAADGTLIDIAIGIAAATSSATGADRTAVHRGGRRILRTRATRRRRLSGSPLGRI
jgi:hypothetical protein